MEPIDLLMMKRILYYKMTNHPLYPKLLVFLQFSLIGLMLLFLKGVSIIGILIFLVGAIVGLLALTQNRIGNFNIQPKMKDNAKLITTVIYAYIRHPMYLSVLLMMLGVFICSPSIIEAIFLLLLTTVLVLKAKKEEAIWSSKTQEYVEYKKQTKLFIPFIL